MTRTATPTERPAIDPRGSLRGRYTELDQLRTYLQSLPNEPERRELERALFSADLAFERELDLVDQADKRNELTLVQARIQSRERLDDAWAALARVRPLLRTGRQA